MCSAIAATGVPALVLSKGHKVLFARLASALYNSLDFAKIFFWEFSQFQDILSLSGVVLGGAKSWLNLETV